MTILKNAGQLKEQLLALGFPAGLEQNLLFQLCFCPSAFLVETAMNFGEDNVRFVLHFERSEPGGEYRCLYFDATLRKQVTIEENVYANGKDVVAMMESIPWSAIGDEGSVTLEVAQDIEKAVAGLGRVGFSGEGRFLADVLRYKFWRDTIFEDRISVPAGIRSRFEVRQHFYLFEGEARITARDAYLFLNNKWLEKQMALKRREVGTGTGSADAVVPASVPGSGKRGRKKKE